MNKKYELICLVSARIDEIERDTVIENIKKLIKEKGGEVTEVAPASEISLGYSIKKEKNAKLVIFKFEYTNLDLAEFKKEIESDKKIIRCFIRKELVRKIIPSSRRTPNKNKKVELKDIDKKIEEIFNSAPPSASLHQPAVDTALQTDEALQKEPSSPIEEKPSKQVSEINIKKDESK
jgi:ribosomal protein S6